MKSFKIIGILAVTTLILQTGAFAAVSTASKQIKKTELCNFIPPNKLNIPVGRELADAGGIDEVTFNKVIDNVSSFYAPIMKAKGGTLQVNRLWTDGTVNASAQRTGNTWILNMYGGLARHPITTEDGFTLVMCHETGHQLGGFPKFGKLVGGSRSSWAANEGQADYFATMKCFRRVFQDADNAAAISSLDVPSTVTSKCSSTFKSTTEINLCVRESMAGFTLAKLLWTLANGASNANGITASAAQPSFDTPNPSVVAKTDDNHPEAQCRLDTYFAGSICGAAYTDDFGQSDPITGACAMEKGDKVGTRPLCWYKPKKVSGSAIFLGSTN